MAIEPTRAILPDPALHQEQQNVRINQTDQTRGQQLHQGEHRRVVALAAD